jgi:hypothetical protein
MNAGTQLTLTSASPSPGTRNYNNLYNKPSINGVELVGDLTSEDLDLSADAKFPTDGFDGDILTKRGGVDGGVVWVTPASSAEQDNTRPITAAAVYTEIGNINALLAII